MVVTLFYIKFEMKNIVAFFAYIIIMKSIPIFLFVGEIGYQKKRGVKIESGFVCLDRTVQNL